MIMFKRLRRNQNREALRVLQELGYPMPRIRKALFVLSGIKIVRISGNGAGASSALLTQVLQGKRRHKDAEQAIARALGLSEKELFTM